MAFAPDWVAEGGASGYALYASEYPTALSIYAAVASSLAGGWNSAVASAPWAVCYAALCLTTYGSLILANSKPRTAMVGTYLISSLPLLNIHASLAGYGDLWMALLSGSGLSLLLVWRLRKIEQVLFLALLLLLAGTQIKTEGWIWLLLGAGFVTAAWISEKIRYRWLFTGIALTAAALWVTGFTQISLGSLGMWGFSDTHILFGPLGNYELRPYDPLANYFGVLFQQANFSLLASVYSIALLLMLVFRQEQAASFWLMGLLIAASQAVIFGASTYSKYAESGTAIARLLIHFTPVTILTVALFWETTKKNAQNVNSLPDVSGEKQRLLDWMKRPPFAVMAILTVAIILPIGTLLSPSHRPADTGPLTFGTDGFAIVVGQSAETDQGHLFRDSPINVGVIMARLEPPSRPLPRYLITEISIANDGDVAFYWIVDGETEVHSISISASGNVIEDLYQYPKWKGEEIKEVGYLVKKRAFKTALIRKLSLQNSLKASDLKILLNQWRASEHTSQRLINNTLGHAVAPISRNTWFNISIFTALIMICMFYAMTSQKRAAEAAAKTIIALWILSDLVHTFSSEPFAMALNEKAVQASPENHSANVLAKAVVELGKHVRNATPILLLAADDNSQYVAQKLPFELLPGAAAHINQRRAADVIADWRGVVAVIGEDKKQLYDTVELIEKSRPDMTVNRYDGFVLLQSKIP